MSRSSSGAVRALARASVVLCLLLVPSAAWAQTKFAVIDLRRAVADTEDGLRVQAELQQLFDNRQAEVEDRQKAFMAVMADLDKLQKSGKASDETMRQKYTEARKMEHDLQTLEMNTRREMQQKEHELMMPIIKQMLALVRRLASQNGYDMVLNKEMVPYFRSDLDITDRIIQMYNSAPGGGDEPAAPAKKPPAGEKKPAPKAPAKK
jgi:outer membrane protein